MTNDSDDDFVKTSLLQFEEEENLSLELGQLTGTSKIGNHKNFRARSDQQRLSCGVLTWRPKCLKPLSNVYVFATLVGLSCFCSKIAYISLSSQMVSIERQFNIDSSTSGLFSSAYHFGYASSVLFVGHFARTTNIPVVVGVAGLTNGLFVMAPGFVELFSLFELPKTDPRHNVSKSIHPNRNDKYLCGAKHLLAGGTNVELPVSNSLYQEEHSGPVGESSNRSIISLSKGSKNIPHEKNVFAYYVLLTSTYLQGFVTTFTHSSLVLIYIDNNILDKTKIGLCLAISSFFDGCTGPVGDLVNAWTSKIPLNLKDTEINQNDSRFVSAWWLSLFIFGILSSISALPIILMPRHLVAEEKQQEALEKALVKFAGGNKRNITKDTDDIMTQSSSSCAQSPKQYFTEERNGHTWEKKTLLRTSDKFGTRTVREMLKGLPKACLKVFKHPLFVLLILCQCITEIPMVGMWSLNDKYFMFEYNVSMATSNLAKGMSSALTHIIGTLLGSALTVRIKTNSGYLKLIIAVTFLSSLVTPLYMALGCDNQMVLGLPRVFKLYMTLSSSITFLISDGDLSSHPNNTRCKCDPDLPLLSCGSDDVTYLSPCFSGCTVSNDSVFTNCDQMIQGQHSYTVRPGICSPDCYTKFILINIVVALDIFLYSIGSTPKHLLALRVLSPHDRAIGIAVIHFVPYVVSLPAPYIYGALIETMCTVWLSDHCVLYDRDRLRYLKGGTAAVVGVLSVLTYSVTLYVCHWWDGRLIKKYEKLSDAEQHVKESN